MGTVECSKLTIWSWSLRKLQFWYLGIEVKKCSVKVSVF